MKIRILLWTLSVVFLGIVSMVGWSSYSYYKMIHADDPIIPNLIVVEGGAKIIRGDIAIELTKSESYDLKEADAVETLPESIAMVNWPDHSVTRLGASSRIVIHQMIAEEGYNTIKVSFSLKKGKIWSNVVHTLIGDSYFETNLPKNNIVAGVRGTVYEINLDHGYIHAVDHGVLLQDDSHKSLILMPGELVDSSNIWIKKGKEFLDTAWTQINAGYDKTYIESRISILNKTISHNANFLEKLYDDGVRWFLGHFQTFEILRIQDILDTGKNIEALSGYSTDALFQYYQRIEGLGNITLNDTLRDTLLTKVSKTGSGVESLLNTLRMGSLWDSLNTGSLLPSAQKILNTTNNSLNQNLEQFKDALTNKDFSETLKQNIQVWMK